MSRTSPLKRLEIKFSGLRKCQTAVLPYFAYLARNPQPDYSLKFGGYKSPGKTYQPSSGPDFAALGFSQQYESQQDVADKVFYVEGCWHSNLCLRVEATHKYCKTSDPADSPAISPSNSAALIPVEPVCKSPLLSRTAQDFALSSPDSRPSRATSVLARRMLLDQFPALVDSFPLRTLSCLLPS